jgi:hypothetical protein
VNERLLTAAELPRDELFVRQLDDRAHDEVDGQRDPAVQRKNAAEERSDPQPVSSLGVSHVVPLVCVSREGRPPVPSDGPDRQRTAPLPRRCNKPFPDVATDGLLPIASTRQTNE